MLVRRRVDRAAVVAADGSSGLFITLIDGQHLDSLAYGASVIQAFFPSKRYARAAAAITAWANEGEFRASGPVRVRRSPRFQ